MRLCVRWLHVCAGEEKRTLRKSAFWTGDVTEKRTLRANPHGKAHSAPATWSRRDQKAHSVCERWLRREAVFADLCTLLHTHGRSRDRAGPRVPRHRRPHEPRDARALGPEAHAAGAVTQSPTYTNSRSLLVRSSQLQSHSELWKSDLAAHPARFNRLEQTRAEQAYKRSRKNLKRVGLDGRARELASVLSGGERQRC